MSQPSETPRPAYPYDAFLYIRAEDTVCPEQAFLYSRARLFGARGIPTARGCFAAPGRAAASRPVRRVTYSGARVPLCDTAARGIASRQTAARERSLLHSQPRTLEA